MTLSQAGRAPRSTPAARSSATAATFCHNDKSADTYYVAVHAPDGAGSYAWSITGDWIDVYVGCGAGDSYCTVRTGGSNADRAVYSSVVVDGTTTYQSRAGIRSYCGVDLC